MIKNKGAFTLVELIVVVTIMGILATIGFVSFTSYLAGTRDTNRIAQLKSMSEALVLYKGKNVSYPLPDDYVEIKSNGEVISYQGYIGKEVLEKIGYSEKGLDPKDKEYFSYYVTKNKRHFELMALLEEEPDETITAGIFNNSYAEDYSDRYAYLKGDKLGIITNEFNVPLQMFTGTLDISNIGDTELIAHISDDYVISGINTDLAVLEEIVKNGGSTISSTSSGPDLTGKCAISQDPNVEVVFDDTYKDDTLYYGTGFYIQSNTCLKWQANGGKKSLAWAKDCTEEDGNDKCEDYTDPEWDGTKYIYDGHYPSGGSEDDFQVHKYCESLGEGWRVPTKREFMSIMTDIKPSGMDYYTSLPSIVYLYWSSDTCSYYNKYAWYAIFSFSKMSGKTKNDIGYYTICVHD